MIDMSTWPNSQADVVDDLHLDPLNVRLETPHGVPESDIIQDLFTNEKALSLVEAIAQSGYFTHELPIVVMRDGQMIVVEGNRRLAALKAIQNPYLVPDHHAKIAKFIAQIPNRDALKKISVKIAPNQDQANQVIAALHTGNQRVAWTPTRQAAFFQAQIDAGKTVPQLLLQYPTVDVKDFVVRSKMLQLFRSVRYRDPELKDYVSGRRFPVSTLARLYEYDKFQDLAQIEVNQDKARVSFRGSRQQFSILAEKIISDIKTRRIDTRVLNSFQSATYQKYMEELRDFINEPPYSKPESGSSSGGASSGSGPAPGGGGSSSGGGSPPGGSAGAGTGKGSNSGLGSSDSGDGSDKGKSKAKAQSTSYLNTDGLDTSGFPPAIYLILAELSSININRFPNATFDLLRTFLEKSTKAYAAKLNEEIKNTAHLNGFVQLSHALTWLDQHLKSEGQTALIQVVQKIRSGKITDFISSKSHLDAINHNHLIFATPSDVRECWNTMKPLLQFMLKP
jgi:uncharacterized membrane protein YgcG